MKQIRKLFMWLLILTAIGSYVHAQKVQKVTGTVLDGNNRPLEAATIENVRHHLRLMSDVNGYFSLNAQRGDSILISYSGYNPEYVVVSSPDLGSIYLKMAASQLEDVVVVGYGIQSRKNVTAAVSTVNPLAFKTSPSTNVGTILEGNVPGLRVAQSTGQPGSTPTLTFRGGSNFDGSGSPLIIMDGVIVPSLYGINMDDVESINLLKDAASTAIYGARASDGVLLITSRKGRKGRSTVSYTYKNTSNYIRRNPLEYLDGGQYIQMNWQGLASRYEADMADGNTSAAATDRNQLYGAWGWAINSGWTSPTGLYSTQLLTDANKGLLNQPGWHSIELNNPFNAREMDNVLYHDISVADRENMILQQNNTQQHYLNFSGANDQGNFALGVGMVKDNGMVIGSWLKRLSMNFNGGLNIGTRLKLTTNIAAYSENSSIPYTSPSGSSTGGLMQRFIGVAPTVRYNNDTSGAILPGPNDITLGNPLYWSNIYNNSYKEQRISGSVNLTYQLLDNLKFIGSASGFLRYNFANYFTKAYQMGNNGSINTNRSASFSNYNDVQYAYNGFLQYDKSLGNHHITAMAGGEFYDYTKYTNSGYAKGAPTDFIPWLVASSSPSVVNGVIQNLAGASSDRPIWYRLVSGIGRLNYDYKGKYLLNANFRYDGTSMLGTNRYGLFPGISLGWNLHQEDFFKNSFLAKYINSIKPRISWGQNGSINALMNSGQGYLPYFATAQVYSNAGIYNGQGGAYAPNYINTDLKWEKAASFDAGLDISLFNNRISISGDYFVKNIFDKIASLPISAQTGFTSFTTNLGQLQNKGLELMVNAKVLKSIDPSGLNIDLSANIYTVKNYVKKLPYNGLPGNRQSTIQVWDPSNPGTLKNVGGLVEGKRVGLDEVWTLKYDGIYTNESQLQQDANVYNAYLPYTNKRLKLKGDADWHQVYQNDTIDYRQFTYVGRTTPSVTGGFSTNISYKGFSLYAGFDYALNFVILNNEKMRGLSQVQGSQNSTVDVLNTWSPSNPNGTLPRYYWANQGRNYGTDASGNNAAANFWEKGDYLMLRELTLNYEVLPSFLTETLKGKLKGLRVFVSGSNLIYFTGYSGNFPEIGGVDSGKFPLPRRLTVGTTITL